MLGIPGGPELGSGNATSPLVIGGQVAIGPSVPRPLASLPLSKDLSLRRGSGTATFTRSTTGTYIDRENGLVKTAAIDAPRFEQEGILIEGASENLLLSSEDFSGSGWSSIGTVNVTTDTAIAPDGTTTADTLDFGANTSRRQFSTISGSTAGLEFTFSVYLKKDVGTDLRLQLVENGGASGAASFQDADIVVTDDWVRYDVSGSVIQDDRTSVEVRVRDLTGGVDVFIWGAQLEELPFASSYIPTTSATVTRTADNLSIEAANIPAPAADYSWGATVETFGATSGNQSLANVIGETSRRFRLATSSLIPQVFHGGDFTNVSGAAITANTTLSLFGVIDSTNITIYEDGEGVSTAKGTAITGTATGISIGSAGGFNEMYGHIKNFNIYDVALTDTQVRAL
jgi:hypothetical protein